MFYRNNLLELKDLQTRLKKSNFPAILSKTTEKRNKDQNTELCTRSLVV